MQTLLQSFKCQKIKHVSVIFVSVVCIWCLVLHLCVALWSVNKCLLLNTRMSYSSKSDTQNSLTQIVYDPHVFIDTWKSETRFDKQGVIVAVYKHTEVTWDWVQIQLISLIWLFSSLFCSRRRVSVKSAGAVELWWGCESSWKKLKF